MSEMLLVSVEDTQAVMIAVRDKVIPPTLAIAYLGAGLSGDKLKSVLAAHSQPIRDMPIRQWGSPNYTPVVVPTDWSKVTCEPQQHPPYTTGTVLLNAPEGVPSHQSEPLNSCIQTDAWPTIDGSGHFER